jgi:hypothetical protein
MRRLRQTLPQEGAKTAHFCSMCGPHFCSMSRGAQAGLPNWSGAEIARHSEVLQFAGKQTTRSVARKAARRDQSAVNITEDVRKCAAEQRISK